MLHLTEDLIAIKEWIAKEQHLPKDLDDHTLTRFIHASKRSLEKTKKRLNRFCCSRCKFPELYTARDPLLPNIQQIFAITCTTNYEYENDEIIIYKYDDPTLEHFSFFDLLKVITMQTDHWIRYKKIIADNHYFILDFSSWSAKMLQKIDAIYLKNILLFLLKGMPVRPKSFIGVNAPPFYEKIIAIVKSLLPSNVHEKIFFYTDYESVYKHIDKKYLPVEYGGEAQSMYEKNKLWIKKMEEDREFFLNDDLWKADLTLIPDGYDIDVLSGGSFRYLNVD